MIHIEILYQGTQAVLFAKEMMESGVVNLIRQEKGNIRYEYYQPFSKENQILLIDEWENQEAINQHHQSEAMNKIMTLRDKYNVHMTVRRFRLEEDEVPSYDHSFIRE